MLKFTGYQNPEEIYKSSNSIICRAFDELRNCPVILKVLNKQYPTTEDTSKFLKEYDLLSRFEDEGVIKAYEKSSIDNSSAIVLEDIGGQSLDILLKSMRLHLEEFLNLAVQITDIIGNIHSRNIIHKDINPSNIIWNIESGSVRIIDLGIATELPREITSQKNPHTLEGTLAYISPEQTGRMNRSLDYRTDFYSLGVTFYWMLTGKLPFESDDLLKLVHSHIAVEPLSPQKIDGKIPGAVSDIVMKMMAKNAENRYLSAYGLKADLEHCRQELRDTGKIKPFKLGSFDASDKFQISEKLYGREDETAALLDAFERVRNNGTVLMLVSGFGGIGKSALINEIQRPIAKYSGYFITGKFERLKKDVPYSAITQAFTGLARQILAESAADISAWKEKILSALGPNGKIVTDILPLFELIIGEQADVPLLGPVESQNRFNLVFLGFIKALVTREHPLVVFLDDLQWADSASLYLLKLFTGDSDIKHLLVIGAYRHNETPDAHPFILTLEEIKKSGAAVNSIFLQPLKKEHINQLLGDTLNRPPEETGPLADMLIEKTGGNPFFVNEFMKSLYTGRLIEFSFEQGWSWDMTGIEKMQATDNVVDLIAGKITDLPDDSQIVLKLGACIGSFFSLDTLVTVSGKSREHVLPALKAALQNGMLNLIDDFYRFSHDRVLEAAYSLISDEEKTRQHYLIGKLELQNIDEQKLPEKIFYIVNQLNAGQGLVNDEDDKLQLAELNLRAGRKALASNAYNSALNYLQTGIKLLKKNSWEKNYRFTLELYQEAAAAAQLCAEYEMMDRLAEDVIKKAATILDTIKVYEVKIFACSARNQLLEGVKIGLYILKKLGVKIPEKPGKLRIAISFILIKIYLKGKSIDSFINLPEMTDPLKRAIMKILSSGSTSAYMIAPELLLLGAINAIKLSVKYGNSKYPPFFYVGFGMIHCGLLGNINAGYKYGTLALKLVEKYNVKGIKSRVWVIFWYFINHWKKPIRDSLIPLLEAYQIGLETGDLEYAAIASYTYSASLFFSGIELTKVESEMAKFSEMIRKINQGTMLNYHLIYYQTILNLRNPSKDPCKLIGFAYNEDKMIDIHKKENDINALFNDYSSLLNLNYLFGKYEKALEIAEIIKPYVKAQLSKPTIPLVNIYNSLTRLALYPAAEKSLQKKFLNEVRKNQKKMKKWAFHSPANYSHKYHLVAAEMARVEGDEKKARRHYELAVNLARENKFLQEEALALELTAKFWLGLNEEKIAALYMQEAYNTYRVWGAAAKVKHIEDEYSHLLLSHSGEGDPQTKLRRTTTTTGSFEDIDLSTVMKTSQALSGEIDLEKLLKEFMRLSLENAGAQRGFLILEKETDQGLYIEAQGDANGEIAVLESIPIEENSSLSSTIINYVNRTGENIVLNNAHGEGGFTEDPYIRENKIKSLLCTALTHKRKIYGILYLENNLTANAFTPGRIELLRIISSQAAISIENARLLIDRENRARLEKEIEMAEKIQRSLLPKEIPDIKGARIAFKYIPMTGVGGDFVNIYHKKDQNKISLFICDVSGHGVPAAMTASTVSYALDFFWDKHFDSPSKIFKEMSNSLRNKMGGNFFTGCICSLDLDCGSLTLSSAGHPPLLIVRKNGDIELHTTRGGIINDFFESNTEDLTLQLNRGDVIMLYTDGITEAENQDREMIGDEDDKFRGWIRKYYDASSSPDEFCENIYKGVVEHTGSNQLDDDFTVLVLVFVGNSAD